jgi:DNA repair and recombination protein RAD52
MAGAFSGHLLHAFNNGPAQPSTPIIVTSGAMSFDARAHGTSAPSLPSFCPPSPTSHAPFGPLSEDSATSRQIATLQAKLNKKLGPEFISQRPGPGGGPKLTYAEGWKIINLANEVFGFNGWSSNIVSIVTDFVDYSEESKRVNVGVTAIVRVTLRDGTYHEDVGYGTLENGKSKGAALDKVSWRHLLSAGIERACRCIPPFFQCKKEAITDALKRTLRNFGNLLGNCLYDKSYAQEVVKIKVPPVCIPFLSRRVHSSRRRL